MTGRKNLALQVPLVVPYKALENFSKALYGATGGTCSARFFRPVMLLGGQKFRFYSITIIPFDKYTLLFHTKNMFPFAKVLWKSTNFNLLSKKILKFYWLLTNSTSVKFEIGTRQNTCRFYGQGNDLGGKILKEQRLLRCGWVWLYKK